MFRPHVFEGGVDMKAFRPFLAVLMLCSMASVAMAGTLVLEGPQQKAGSGEYQIQGNCITVSVCTQPPTQGVTINAVSRDCVGRIKWTANGFQDMAGVFRCTAPGSTMYDTPTTQTWGLIAVTVTMLGFAGITFYRRRRA
jgi:hypothetical protein